MELRLKVPRAFLPLLARKRYKGARGGRGGAKSHFFAEQAIKRCCIRKTSIVCIREVQKSIKESVKKLLEGKIAKFGLSESFVIVESEIRGPYGSQIIFMGMQSYNAVNIKSLEDYDVAWVEEAQALSQASFDMLYPTLRTKGSELWFSWNPRFKTDAVDKFFRENEGDTDVICVTVNWRDNPWFPDTELPRERLRDLDDDPDRYEHIWEGAYGNLQGAILSRWVNQAQRDGRINDDVAYDAEGPGIEISSDIGFRDTAGWWYWQRRLGGFALLKYEGESGLDADDWIPRIQKNITDSGWKLSAIHLPHDARVKTFQSKHSSVEKFLEAFGAGKVDIVPQSKKSDQISAARTVIKRCEFHETNCEDGIDGLRAWEYEFNPDTQAFSKDPLHNWASHPSDGFAYGCQVMEEVMPAETAKVIPIKGITVGQVSLGITFNDLWEETPQHRGRV